MARRPNFVKNDALTAKQLEEFTRSMSRLTLADVERKFRDAADRCRFNELPSPKTVQELVAAWKVLWKWNRRR
jgi:hypothetical protein